MNDVAAPSPLPASAPRFVVLPAGQKDFLRDAVVAGGGVVVDQLDPNREDGGVDGVVWTDPKGPAALAAILRAHPKLGWIQLPWAGIEHYRSLLDRARIWTAGQGVYADDVAEHALALTLALLRRLPERARADHWGKPLGRSLRGAQVTLLGGGGIAQSFARLVQPFAPTLTVVRKRPLPFVVDGEVDGEDSGARVLGLDRLDEALTGADVVVVCWALVPETAGLLNARTLSLLPKHAVVVNVGRGGHIVTDDLIAALRAGSIGGAGLDVTDPEPLPAGHPLFSLALITPHCANTPEMAMPVLTARVRENVRRFGRGEALLGIVDVDAGY